MKSYMPISRSDLLYNEMAQDFLRPADFSKFDISAEWVKINFKTLVHPFANSISGTILAAFRTIKGLNNENENTFDNIEKIKTLIKCISSIFIFNSGGHSLYEFIYPCLLPEIREAFSFIPRFNTISLESLFMMEMQEHLIWL